MRDVEYNLSGKTRDRPAHDPPAPLRLTSHSPARILPTAPTKVHEERDATIPGDGPAGVRARRGAHRLHARRHARRARSCAEAAAHRGASARPAAAGAAAATTAR